MKNFIKNIIIYSLSLICIWFIMLVFSSYFISRKNFKNNETESNLLIIKKNKKIDLLMMGISHARNFSRDGNHQKVEKILNKKIINLGQGKGACGANEQLFYLDYFYKKNNHAKQIIYFISPPLFFSESLPIASNTFDIEPFKFDFFWNYLFFKTENKNQRIWSYMQSKLKWNWFKSKPNLNMFNNRFLTQIDSLAVVEGHQLTYGEKLSLDRFNKTKISIEKTIKLAIKNNSKVILIIPPALFGKWKGHEKVVEFAHFLKLKYKTNIQFYDYSNTVLEPQLYYDHHHLNTNGVSYFSQNFLIEIL